MPAKKTTAAAAAQHTHADLEKKVAALEKEVAALKKELVKAKGGADPRVDNVINAIKIIYGDYFLEKKNIKL